VTCRGITKKLNTISGNHIGKSLSRGKGRKTKGDCREDAGEAIGKTRSLQLASRKRGKGKEKFGLNKRRFGTGRPKKNLDGMKTLGNLWGGKTTGRFGETAAINGGALGV